MTNIIVDFGNSEEIFSLTWVVRNTTIAQKWLSLLENSLPFGIYERDRIYNFPNQSHTDQTICNALNACMDKIEERFENFFKVRPYVGMSHEITNELHVYFEILRGSVDEPSNMFINSPTDIQQAINQYNILIHRRESLVRSTGKPKPRIVCSFNSAIKPLLSEEEYNNFTLEHNYGAMVINYPIVGKQLMDVFYDNDSVVGSEAIRPMDRIGPAWRALFFETTGNSANKIKQNFSTWFTENKEYLNSCGFYLENNKIALGYIIVADLQSDLNRTFIEEEIGRLSQIYNVRITE